MRKRLDDLREQYENSRNVAAELGLESAELKEALAAKQDLVMETVRKDLREFAGYASGLHKGWLKLILDDCTLDFYRSSYGRNPCLIIQFEPDGDVKIKANPDGYSHLADVYELKQDRWGWYGKDCKAFVTENWGMIAEKIEDGLAKAFEKASKDVVGRAVEERDALQKSIGAVSENIDWGARKDAILYNAISLLIDETCEEYDDTQEWLEMMQRELGVTLEELEALGFDLEKPLEHVLFDASQRSIEGARDRGPGARESIDK